MKINTQLFIYTLSILCLLDVTTPAQQTKSEIESDKTNEVKLLARVNKNHYNAGEQIKLELTITNRTDKPFAFSVTTSVLTDWDIRIVGLHDKKISPLTRAGSNLRNAGPFEFRSKILNPGKTFTSVVILNQLFDVTIPQEYEVIVSKGKGLVSNPVRFSVSAFNTE